MKTIAINFVFVSFFLSGCCSFSDKNECNDDYAFLNFRYKGLTTTFPPPNDSYFIIISPLLRDSLLVNYKKGASYYRFEYHFNSDPNFNFLDLNKNTYIYVIPRLGIRDTFKIVKMDYTFKSCGTCSGGEQFIQTESASYTKNGIKKEAKAEDLYSGLIIN